MKKQHNETERYYQIVDLYHLKRYTQKEIGEIFKITHQRVQQILKVGIPVSQITKTNIKKGLTKNEYQKEYRKLHSFETRARHIVYTKLRNKTLVKQPCFCGKIKSEAHHEDYNNPLDIVWLCKKHHVEADNKRRLMANNIAI